MLLLYVPLSTIIPIKYVIVYVKNFEAEIEAV